MTLSTAAIQKEYIIKEINSGDQELDAFLFSLGCYQGEPITIINRKKNSLVVAIKESRYNFDNDLASCILVEEQYRRNL